MLLQLELTEWEYERLERLLAGVSLPEFGEEFDDGRGVEVSRALENVLWKLREAPRR